MVSPHRKNIDASMNWQYQHLQKQGYIIKHSDKQGKHFWKLTTKGLNFIELWAVKFGKKPKWDKKWRVLIFDVPEDKRIYRNFLRRKLKELGFCKLQQSVWVTPYAVPKAFSWFLNQYHLGKMVRYMVVEEINFDKDLKDFFKL